MRFYLAVLLSCAFLQTVSAGQQNLIIPLRIALKWLHEKGGLRSSSYCSDTEMESTGAFLGSELSITASAMRDFLGLEKVPGGNHISCNNKICDGDFPVEFHKVPSQDEVAGVHNVLMSQCTEILHGLSRAQSYSSSCRNALKSAMCESSFMIAAA
jgi:hypothetical protein